MNPAPNYFCLKYSAAYILMNNLQHSYHDLSFVYMKHLFQMELDHVLH